MKTSYILFVLLFGPSINLPAQEDVVELSFPLGEGQRAVLNLRFADKIEVKTWNKKELFVRASIVINDGLMNEAHKIDTIMDNDAIEISTGFDEEMIRGNKYNNCNGQNRSQHNFDGRRGRNYSICHTINYAVFLPASTDLEIETISGDIAIENMTSKVDAKSISGVVDLVVAKNHKADILLESVTGRAYTEPALFTTRDGLQSLLSRRVSGQLNGGGKKLHLESVSGNVRLRQVN
jgi:hypothetical protein